MGQNIDYATVEASVVAMRDIADKIGECKDGMRYYSYGSIDTKGEFADSFEQMKSMIQRMAGDIESFINDYADVIDTVAKNFESLDNEMQQHIITQSGMWV